MPQTPRPPRGVIREQLHRLRRPWGAAAVIMATAVAAVVVAARRLAVTRFDEEAAAIQTQ